MVLRYVALLVLTATSAVAAVGLTTRVRLAGTAERLVAATLVWNLLVLLPIYALGYAHTLTAASLASASVGVSTGTLVASSFGRSWQAHVRDVARAVWEMVRLPVDAVRFATRPVGVTVAAVLAVEALILWSAMSAYYAHAFRMWDSLWYHEPIVAFTIQYRGFENIPLPDSLQRINSFPRAGEMTDLWFAIFAGRRLVDLANSVIAPAVVAVEYVLCARFARSRVTALGWACAFFFMPTVQWQLASSFVDLHLAFALLAALCFATRPELRLSHVLLAAVALALAVGIKYSALVPAGIIGVIALIRAFASTKARILHKTAVAFAGASAIGATMASTYLRNYLLYGNPFWPYLIPSHPEWPGFAETNQDLSQAGVAFGVARADAIASLFSARDAAFNYGLAFIYVMAPLSCIALAVLAGHFLVAAASRGRVPRPVTGVSPGGDGRSILMLVLMCAPAVASVWTSAAPEQARYQIFAAGVVVVVVAWFTGASWIGGVAGDGAIGAVCVLTWLGYSDAEPRFILQTAQMRELARHAFPEREFIPESGGLTIPEAGTARERELGPGDLVVFGDDYGAFPAEFFNNAFSNRAIYVPDSDTFVADAEALGAKWIFCSWSSNCLRKLSQPGSRWNAMGELHTQDPGKVFHRFGVGPVKD